MNHHVFITAPASGILLEIVRAFLAGRCRSVDRIGMSMAQTLSARMNYPFVVRVYPGAFAGPRQVKSALRASVVCCNAI